MLSNISLQILFDMFTISLDICLFTSQTLFLLAKVSSDKPSQTYIYIYNRTPCILSYLSMTSFS